MKSFRIFVKIFSEEVVVVAVYFFFVHHVFVPLAELERASTEAFELHAGPNEIVLIVQLLVSVY